MDFKAMYEKYLAGECTQEEKILIEEELEKARLLNEVILSHAERPEIKTAENDAIIKAKKKFNLKLLIKMVAISMSVVLVLSAIALGTIFGLAILNAKKNCNYSQQQAQEMVIEYIYDYARTGLEYTGTKEAIKVTDKIDRDLETRIPFSKSHYVYDFDLLVGFSEVEIEFNAKSGECSITEIDR